MFCHAFWDFFPPAMSHISVMVLIHQQLKMTTLYFYRFPSVAVKTSKMVIVRTLKADKADLFLVVCSFHCNIDLLVTYLIVA